MRIRVRPQPARAFSVARRIAGSASMPRSERATGPCAFSSAVTAARTSVSSDADGTCGRPWSRRAPLAALCFFWSGRARAGGGMLLERRVRQPVMHPAQRGPGVTGERCRRWAQPADGTGEPDHARLREDPECGHDGRGRARPSRCTRAGRPRGGTGGPGTGLLPHAATPQPGTWPTSGAAPGQLPWRRGRMLPGVGSRALRPAQDQYPACPAGDGDLDQLPVYCGRRLGRGRYRARGHARPTRCRQPGSGQGAWLRQRPAAIRPRSAGSGSLGAPAPRR